MKLLEKNTLLSIYNFENENSRIEYIRTLLLHFYNANYFYSTPLSMLSICRLTDDKHFELAMDIIYTAKKDISFILDVAEPIAKNYEGYDFEFSPFIKKIIAKD